MAGWKTAEKIYRRVAEQHLSVLEWSNWCPYISLAYWSYLTVSFSLTWLDMGYNTILFISIPSHTSFSQTALLLRINNKKSLKQNICMRIFWQVFDDSTFFMQRKAYPLKDFLLFLLMKMYLTLNNRWYINKNIFN